VRAAEDDVTQELFREDAYLRGCDARVVAVAPGWVELDRTVFYPQGGGQPGDAGTLRRADGAEIAISDTRHEGDRLLHVLPPDAPTLQIGEAVVLALDWQRRYAHMRMHTSLHLLGAVLRYGVTGGSIGAQRSRLDFERHEGDERERVDRELNALIEADHAVETLWITPTELDAQPELIRTLSVRPPAGAGRIRLLHIPGVDLQPCGGTHVLRTREIGPVRLGRIEKKGARNRRVYVELV
jgi:misacylated tRNA(Ala) deacylase